MSMKRASSRLLLGLLGVATSAGLVLGGKAVVDSVAKGAAEVGAAAEGDKYVKVTENLTDWSGDYLIVWEEGNAAFDGSLATLDAVNDYISVTIADSAIEWTAEIAKSQFTIDAIADGYSIKSASGYYVYQTSDANGLKSSTTTTGTNAISLGSDGISIVSGGAYLRFNAASDQMRFRYYKSGSYARQKPIALYKLETAAVESQAESFAAEFLSKMTCSDNAVTAADGTWDDLATKYEDLAESDKEIFQNAKADANSDNVVEQAVARYDRIVGKYGVTTYKDFMARTPANISGALTVNSSLDGSVYVVVGISIAAIGVAAAMFFLRKKKEA